MSTLLAPAPTWAAYAAGSRIDHFKWWARENCRHAVGPFAGQPLELEPFQDEFLGEGLAVDEHDMPYWQTVVEILSRKNGKSTKTSALGAYEADQEDDGPLVGLAATSDEQVAELFDPIAKFVEASPYLTGRFHVRDYDGEIARKDGAAFIRRMKMDWRRLHGKNLSKLLADELHAWSTPNLHKCWEALTTGDGARPGFQTWCITSEGEPESGQSILAQLIAVNEQLGEVEHRPGLTISRNHEARVLIYRYSAPMPAADPKPVREAHRDWRLAERAGAADAAELRTEYERALERCVEAVKLANPASWITPGYLRRKVLDPKISRSAFLRFHACVAVAGDDEEPYISPEEWAALGDGEPLEEDRWVCVGADGSRTHDTTVVAWAGPAADGRVDVDARIFSVRKDAPHHVLHDGKIDYDDVEEFIIGRFALFDVAEAAYDPRYLDRSAEILDARLPEAAIIAVEPQSRHMRDALAAFHRGVSDGTVRHRADPAIAAHVAACRGEQDERGWVVRKRKHSKPIDAVIAMALAYWRATQPALAPVPWGVVGA